MNEVPLTGVVAQNEPLWPELRSALEPVVMRGEFVLGPTVECFEREFAAYLGLPHAVGVGSGGDALALALRAVDVGPGDEVVTSPLAAIDATAAIRSLGGCPVYVDVDPVTFNLDPALVARAITPRTRALLAVHLYGQSADLVQLVEIAQRSGVPLVEDASQAPGAVHAGRRIGTWGRIGCFSFHPARNLGALGEAGALVTSDDRLAIRLRRLRNGGHTAHEPDDVDPHHTEQDYSNPHHLDRGYVEEHDVDQDHLDDAELACKTRMDSLQAAVLRVKLRYLDRGNATRSLHAERYHDLLGDCPHLALPRARSPEGHVWNLFVVLVRDVDRAALRHSMKAAGITTGLHYPSLAPFHPACAELGYRQGDFPIAEYVAAHCLSLPMFPELAEAQIDHVAEALWELLSEPQRIKGPALTAGPG